ncbi:MAG: type II secretion system protein [Deltaproteobacteria bacterium]|nr:MAG: type II secretion system protein [Deltaproteobacteria bacterium]
MKTQSILSTRKDQRGFTLIELVLVITILGILAVTAMPNFINVSQNAEDNARMGIVGSIREGISLQKAQDLVQHGPPGNFPAALDAAADGTIASSASPIFGSILHHPITSDNWTKVNATTYTYNDGTSSFTFTYNPATGSFSAPGSP